MKKFTAFYLLLTLAFSTMAQGVWTTLNPYPTANDVYAGSALGPDRFIALSNYDQCFLTTDGGINWTISSYDTTESIIRNLYFINDTHGWAAGALGGGFYRTTDGGASWIAITNAPDTTKYGIHFATPLIGWSVGFNGLIIKTTDGGDSWFSQTNTGLTNKTLYGVYAVDTLNVYVVGNTATVLKSTDGGATFAQVSLGSITSADYRAVRFLDANNGFVVGARHRIIRTTDGGLTWTQQNDISSTSRVLWDIDFNSQGVGIAAGTDTVAFRTTDFGATWAQFILPGGSAPGVKYAVDFHGDNTVLINGGRGYLAKSSNAGLSFTEMGYRFTSSTINDIAFADAFTGFVCGTAGFIGKTTDGGLTWETLRVPNGRKINEITVPNHNTIYGACDSSRIVMSKDGGLTWTEYSAGLGNTTQFIAIDHASPDIVMTTGSNGIILKTTDGGGTWAQFNLPSSTLAWDIDIVDTTYAWICGTGETIFRTTDGGATWVQQFSAGGLGSYGVSFVDTRTGFVAGTSGNTYWTTDGGATWTPATVKPGNTVWSTAMVKLGDQTVAFAACASGYAYISNDGGITWKEQPRQTINTFNDMYAFDAGTAWFAGNSGIIIKYVDPSIVPVEMLSFTSTVQDDDVIIAWSIGNTINNLGMTLERTTLNTENWKAVHYADANGQCGLCSYEFIDRDLKPGLYRYRLAQRDVDGTVNHYYLAETVQIGVVTDYALEQNYPNPFNPVTVIRFALPTPGQTTLEVFSSSGEKVAELVNGELVEGVHEITFNAEKLGSGVYFYRLNSGKFTQTRKLLLIK